MKLLANVLNVIHVVGMDEYVVKQEYVRLHLVMSTVLIKVQNKSQMVEMFEAFRAYAEVLDIRTMTTATGVVKPIRWNEDVPMFTGTVEVEANHMMAKANNEDDQYWIKVHKKGDGVMITNKHDWSDPEALEQGKAFLNGRTA